MPFDSDRFFGRAYTEVGQGTGSGIWSLLPGTGRQMPQEFCVEDPKWFAVCRALRLERCLFFKKPTL